MKADYTHIAVILDRTGSMASIRDETIAGFNGFLNEQKAAPGFATLTLVQFDTADPYEVIHRFKPIEAVPELNRETYVPRARTPLLDAMGRGIIDLEESLAAMDEHDRPARVIMAIITDGRENASREFRKDEVKRMIEEKREREGWEFIFLGADLDGVRDARRIGITRDAVLAYDKDAAGTVAAWKSVSKNVADYRAARKHDAAFTEEDRAKQKIERERRAPNSPLPPTDPDWMPRMA